MADPSITDARCMARRYRKDVLVVFHFDDHGRFGYASYGKDRRTCDRAGEFAEVIAAMVETGEIQAPTTTS